MENKTCTTCFNEKPISEFYKKKDTKDGLSNMCKVCANNYTYEYAKNNRLKVKQWKDMAVSRNREIVKKYLQTHSCVDCGESDIVVLDFDHVRGKKLGNISDMVKEQVSEKRLLAEIAKCDIRCANDHRRVTHQRRTVTQR